MKRILDQIVKIDETSGKKINQGLLERYTRRLSGVEALVFPWRRVRQLYILGKSEDDQSDILSGTYVDESNQWVLVVGAETMNVQTCVERCGPMLEKLVIHSMFARVLNVRSLTGLKELELWDLFVLGQLRGLERLRALEHFALKTSVIGEICFTAAQENLRTLRLIDNRKLCSLQGMHHLSQVESIAITLCPVERIVLNKPLPNLKVLMLRTGILKDAGFISMLPRVRELSLLHTEITSIPSLESHTALERLNLAYNPIDSLDDVVFPETLQWLDLNGCSISRIPDTIRSLPNLRNLGLRNLKLEDLPDWLPDLRLTIGKQHSNGINLGETTVEGLDMTIFDQPQEMIWLWFEARKAARAEQNADIVEEAPLSEPEEEPAKPLNELKIVFLGDGGAGKSRTIARLLLDGANTEDFPNVSTPGIVIKDKDYDLGDKSVKVHFWDFGGQDILHSMHRMFLTERTLYVVMLNVRDGTQDERGRYWLHNIKSFARGAPVLLVLNQMDSNRNAKVNRPDLTALYPQLREVVAMSALEDDRASVEGNLIAELKRQVGAFPTLESPFLPAWSRLKEKLGAMEKYYISGEEFEQLCAECGVEDSETIRLALLRWFSDLGVSFHYGPGVKLRSYVILRPDWITNAIYTIIFNKSEQTENGLISHEAIYELLSSDAKEIRRAIPEMRYDFREVDYVLSVVRKFRLSFQVGEDTEFIPMLCGADSLPIAAEYEADPSTLEFRMEYDYLPGNVLHRLMVDLQRDLDTDRVWLTGALFRQKSSGLSAVVKTEGNVLRIFVRSEDARHRPHTYLNIFRDALAAIHQSMNLAEPKALVVYKKDGKRESFSYNRLLGTVRSGGREVYSDAWDRMISVEDILDQTDREVERRKRKLFADIADACLQIQSRKLLWTASEDERNTDLRNALHNKGYDVSDQTFFGVSAGEKQAGELDLLIRNEQRQPWMICEAMNLAGGGKTQLEYWEKHLNKLLINYNPVGLQDLILVSYVEADADKFNSLWQIYSEHMRWYDPPEALRREGTYQAVPVLEERYDCLRTVRCTYDRGGMPANVYHYFLRMGK